MNCPKCSTENSGTSKFCSGCGVELVTAPAPNVQRDQAADADRMPAKLQVIAIVQLFMGILEILAAFVIGIYLLIMALGLAVETFGIGLVFMPLLIPWPLAFLAAGTLSLVSAVKGLKKKTSYGLSATASIFQMLLLLGCDLLGFAAGLTNLILINSDEVKEYFKNRKYNAGSTCVPGPAERSSK